MDKGIIKTLIIAAVVVWLSLVAAFVIVTMRDSAMGQSVLTMLLVPVVTGVIAAVPGLLAWRTGLRVEDTTNVVRHQTNSLLDTRLHETAQKVINALSPDKTDTEDTTPTSNVD